MPGVVPPGGFYFFSGESKIIAPTLEDLITAVTNDRINNNHPIGNPALDINEAICSNFPASCIEMVSDCAAEERDLASPLGRTLLDSVRLTTKLGAAKAGETKLETREVASDRSAICLNCPENVPVQAITTCTPCVAELDRQALLIRQNNPIPIGLGICRATFQDNRFAVYMPDEALTRSKRKLDDTPDFCWLRPPSEAAIVAE